jgi:hypothetical protein
MMRRTKLNIDFRWSCLFLRVSSKHVGFGFLHFKNKLELMQILAKPIEKISYTKLLEHPVWEFVPESENHDETWARPVKNLPVCSLTGRFVASRVKLANGQFELAILGNIEINDPKQNEHFLCLGVVKPNGQSFDLARYHDVNYDRSGPIALGHFLNLPIEAVFPIEYDISAVVQGLAESLSGIIQKDPAVRLSQDELIAMAVG